MPLDNADRYSGAPKAGGSGGMAGMGGMPKSGAGGMGGMPKAGAGGAAGNPDFAAILEQYKNKGGASGKLMLYPIVNMR
jgi:hypothetical protein